MYQTAEIGRGSIISHLHRSPHIDNRQGNATINARLSELDDWILTELSLRSRNFFTRPAFHSTTKCMTVRISHLPDCKTPSFFPSS